MKAPIFAGAVMSLAGSAFAQVVPPPPPAQPAQPAATQPAKPAAYVPVAVDVLRKEANRLRALVKADDVQRFLFSTTWLPVIDDPRTIYIDKAAHRVLSKADYEKLPEADRAPFKPEVYDAYRFYYTRYGTPLAYCRPLDLVAEHVAENPFRYRKIIDYGYGTIGHLRILASIGNQVVGVDVDPVLGALYSDPEDTGKIQGVGMNDIMNDGHLTLLTGHWPGDKAIADAAGDGFDLFISKNTLKNGYINPEQEVDKRMLVDLGVPQDQFVAKVASVLKPGGLFMIYNICPAQKPKGQGFIPWADGRCPFPKEMLEKAGFAILNYNTDDTKAVQDMAKALEWDQGDTPMDIEHDLFATYTLAQKKVAEDKPATKPDGNIHPPAVPKPSKP